MKFSPILPAALLLPLAVACAPTNADQARDIRAPAATVVGEPVSCLSTSNIRSTKVWDDYTIDFETVNGRTYRNTFDHGCPRLGFEERFAYQTSINRLCSADIITVLDSGGGRGASCGLSQFVPIEVAKN
jgi:hypothetical protein